jgi:EpsD family peptidyl-prolyl cis-trans isomerase
MSGADAERVTDMTNGFDNAAPRRAIHALLMAGVATLAACGNAGSGGSQVVASVGSDEITETQVNHALEHQANVRPDQAAAVSRKAVSGLVEQAIVLQKARDLKIDRDERVMQNVEAMKRELIVAAYLDRIADGAAKPSEKDIQKYYDENPELFSQRRIYTFQDVVVDATPAQRKDVQAQLALLKTAPEIGEYLKARQIPARSSQSTQAAESIPLMLLKRVALLKPGQGLIVSNDGGLRILMLNAALDSPMTEEQARPGIGAFLVAQNKRQVVQKELASLQAGAKVAYFGKYADMAASAPTGGAPASSAGVPVASAGPASAVHP